MSKKATIMTKDEETKKQIAAHIQRLLKESNNGEILALALVRVYDPKKHRFGSGPASTISCNNDEHCLALLEGGTVLKDMLRDNFVGAELKKRRKGK